MAPPKARLLIAEDSAYMLMAIRTMVKLAPGIEIVGEARDGVQAVEMAKALKPDIVTMDVNMPGLNGIAATARIMAEAPTVVIMLSSMTDTGVAVTREALEAGAVDYLPKSMSAVDVDIATIATRFAGKIEFWSRSARTVAQFRFKPPPLAPETDVLAIFGGHGSALVAAGLLKAAPAPSCPVLIHLDELSPSTAASYIDHLAREIGRPVQEGRHRGPLVPGTVTVLPGGRAAGLRKDETGVSVNLRGTDITGDVVGSVIAAYRNPALVMLSGAARPLVALRQPGTDGASLIVQDPITAACPDLPEAVLALGRPVRVIEARPAHAPDQKAA